jgi:hypothetical protein
VINRERRDPGGAWARPCILPILVRRSLCVGCSSQDECANSGIPAMKKRSPTTRSRRGDGFVSVGTFGRRFRRRLPESVKSDRRGWRFDVPMEAANYLAACRRRHWPTSLRKKSATRKQWRFHHSWHEVHAAEAVDAQHEVRRRSQDRSLWPGYAVLIVGAEGSRRVVIGRTDRPSRIRREARLHGAFSTGKPKTTDRLFRTAYLCVQNNQVGDIVNFESGDHVKGSVKISLRVNFRSRVRRSLGSSGSQPTTTSSSLPITFARSSPAWRSDIPSPRSKGTTSISFVTPFSASRAILSPSVLDSLVRERDAGDGGRGARNGLADPNIAKTARSAQTEVVKANIEIDQARRDLETTTGDGTHFPSEGHRSTETKMKGD